MALVPSQSVVVAVGAASAQAAITLAEGQQYQVASTTASWIATGSNPSAVIHGATNATYLPANYPIMITAVRGDTKIAVIQDTAGGFMSVTPYL